MTLKQEKDRKNAIDFIGNNVRFKLLDFQDAYFGAYTSWNIKQIELRLEKAKKDNLILNSGNSKAIIDRLQTILSRKNILTCEFIAEAKKGYDDKFNKLIVVLVDNGIGTRFLKVEKIKSAGNEFAFLVSDDKIEVHARAIFVNGDIKAPHYRFITTVRKY